MNRVLFVFIILVYTPMKLIAQEKQQGKPLEDLLNFMVGGVWVSNNANNDGSPETFKTFFMYFENWSSRKSVRGNIFGVKNNGDTTQLIEVWNYINPSENNIFLVQRTSWNAHGIGSIELYEGKHFDISFKTTTAESMSYYTRDIHYIISYNEIRSESFEKLSPEEEWKPSRKSTWKRT